MQLNQPEGLKRAIGIRKLAVSGVNLTIGAGIFALPATVAGYLGAASIVAYALCALVLSSVLLCFIEIGSKLTSTGGVYTYVGLAFGPFAGFLTNMLFVGFALGADAAVANVLVENLSVIIPALKNPIWNIGLLIFIFVGIALMNVFGIKQGIRLVEIITIAKVLPLVLLILIGALFISGENLSWPSANVFENFGEASLILFFAFGGGIEATLNATGEIKDPGRTIPRGVLLAALAVFFIYISIQFVAQGVLGSGLPAQGEAPLAAVAERIIGQSGTWFMVLGAAISCFGLISGDILATSRLPYAAARDGLLPKLMAKVHPRFATPYWAIIIYSAAGLILSLSGGFRQLAILSSAAILLVYVGVILAAIKLRKLKSNNSFTIPGGLIVHFFALGSTIWFLSHLSKTEVVATLIFISFFSIVYFLYSKFKDKRQ